jgi:hypothetical protein
MRTVILIGLCIWLLPACFGQNAQIMGRITDPSDAVMPDVQVEIANARTGMVRKTQTNSEGYYSAPLLTPGEYRMLVQASGFKPRSRDRIILNVDQVLRIDYSMEVGSVTETVEVTAAQPLLESGDANFGQVVTQRSVDALPLNGRDPMFLLSLTPGVTTNAGFGSDRNWERGQFTVGGGRMLEQEVLLDGAPNTSSDVNYLLYIPPVDSTEEFKVLANPVSAEYGRTGGGVVSMISKSGTNEYHGVAYEFHRNSALDANQFFNNRGGLPKTSFRRHQFGANMGGRIRRDRTFFFADFEGFREAIPSTLISSVPTAAQKAGDFSSTFAQNGRLITIHDPLTLVERSAGAYERSPFPGNRIPAGRLNPVAMAAAKYYPEPNTAGAATTGLNNYIAPEKLLGDKNKYGVKIDHVLGNSSRLSGRYSTQAGTRKVPGRWDSVAAPDRRDIRDTFHSAVITNIHSLSPTAILEVRTSYSRGVGDQLSPSRGFDPATLGFASGFVAAANKFFPTFSPGDVTGLGNQFINIQPRETYGTVASLTKIAGAHTIKAGGDMRLQRFHRYQDSQMAGAFSFGRLFTQGPNPLQANANAGYGFASFLLGAGSGGQISHIAGLSLQSWYHALYVQDDWKITSRLTLSLGLRYDVNRGPTERYDRLAWLDLDAPSPMSGQVGLPLRGQLQYLGTGGNRRNQLLTDWNNFAPRGGLAYRFKDNTVLRMGYGIFFVPVLTRDFGSIGFNTQTPWVATLDNLRQADTLQDPFPKGFNFPSNTRDPLTNVGFAIAGQLSSEPVGYAQQWHVSIQRQFAPALMVETSYWGNKGTKLGFGVGFEENFLPNQFLALGTELNRLVENPFFGLIPSGTLSGPQVARRQLLLPFPQYTSVRRESPMAASSIFHGFTVKAERRATSDLSFTGSYSLSKVIGDSSARIFDSGPIQNMQDRRAERHLLDSDVPQRLVGAVVWDLPFGRNRRFGSGIGPVWNHLFGGWRLSGITTFQSGIPVALGRPVVNTGKSAKLDSPTINRWFDTSVFQPAAPFTFGNVGPALPDVRQDGIGNIDFTLSKDVAIRELFRLQFRTDFFNAFNSPQFGAPSGSVTSAAFGQVTSQANAPRQIQLGMKLYW